MSYLSDKVPCSECGELFDPTDLNEDDICFDCWQDGEMLDELIEDERRGA